MSLVVDEEDQVTNPEVTQSAHEALDAEAVRVTETLQFKPGRDGGEPVKVKLTMPFTFRLPADTTGTPPGQ
ncbi:MAG: energy transducer TonB [Rhodothermales bacterium]